MGIKISLAVFGLFVLALVCVVAVNRHRLDKAYAERVGTLLAGNELPAGKLFRVEDLAGLPAPVQRYLAKVIQEGQPYVETVRLRQVGHFRLGDTDAPWKALQAEQYFTTTPPGFVWDARIDMAPLVRARVIDLYQSGQGLLRAKIFSTLTVAEAQRSVELNTGELMRHLAEAVWFPTAFLPGQGIAWLPIDDRAAKATITHGDTRASLVFYFDDRDQVERIHAERWYQRGDGAFELVPWTGTWRHYQARNGLLIPNEGEVKWHLADGDLPYWRAHLVEIAYNIEEQADD